MSPGDIQVRVTNDSGVPGLAKQAAAELRGPGLHGSRRTSPAPARRPTGSSSATAPAWQEAARTVAAVYPGAQLREDKLLGSTIELSMGVGLAAGGRDPEPARHGAAAQADGHRDARAPARRETIKARTAAQDICT